MSLWQLPGTDFAGWTLQAGLCRLYNGEGPGVQSAALTFGGLRDSLSWKQLTMPAVAVGGGAWCQALNASYMVSCLTFTPPC